MRSLPGNSGTSISNTALINKYSEMDLAQTINATHEREEWEVSETEEEVPNPVEEADL